MFNLIYALTIKYGTHLCWDLLLNFIRNLLCLYHQINLNPEVEVV